MAIWSTAAPGYLTSYVWHMETLAQLCAADESLLRATSFQTVDLSDAGSRQGAIDWWLQLTEGGGEGIVVKPCDFVVKGRRGLV